MRIYSSKNLSWYTKYYHEIDPEQARILDWQSVEDNSAYSLYHEAWLVAKSEYEDILADNGLNYAELVSDPDGKKFLAQEVNGRVYDVSDEILELLNY